MTNVLQDVTYVTIGIMQFVLMSLFTAMTKQIFAADAISLIFWISDWFHMFRSYHISLHMVTNTYYLIYTNLPPCGVSKSIDFYQSFT